MQALRELNPDVQGEFVESTPDAWVFEDNVMLLNQFTLFIAAGISEETLVKLEQLCPHAPIVVCRVNGFFGYLRVSVPDSHCVVETHPDTALLDLRLDCPWDELKSYGDSIDVETLDSMEKAHVPFIVILIQSLQQFGKTPKNSDEKKAFKEYISKKYMVGSDNENVEEAHKHVFRACNKTTIPSHTREILENDKCENVSVKSSNFWLLSAAVSRFVQENGVLPLPGSLPDMKADTTNYIKLQTLYHNKATADRESVKAKLHSIMDHLKISHDQVSQEELELYCRNISTSIVLGYKSLTQEFTQVPAIKNYTSMMQESSYNALTLYILFRAAESFHTLYKLTPGQYSSDTDLPLFKKHIHLLLQETWSLPEITISDDAIHEFTRAGGAELHNIASLMGGVVAQECLKVLTDQYVPVNNTWVFDGMHSVSSSMNL